MKNYKFWLLLIVWFAFPVSAKDANYTWNSYPFTISLPEGWVATPDDSRLVMGVPEDVAKVIKGESATGMVVEVHIVPAEERTLENAAPIPRPTIESVTYGSKVYPTITNIPVMAGRQSHMILVADTFLLTISAPANPAEDFGAITEALVASIEAQPVHLSAADSLTQRLTWRGLSFTVPANWVMSNVGEDNVILITTRMNVLTHGSTFRWSDLMLEIRDLSLMRSVLGADSLPVLSGVFYTPDRYKQTSQTTANVHSLPAPSLDFASDSEAGRALLVLTPRQAYLLVGIAGKQQWADSESALFEAILAMLTVMPDA
jgi:hypothetical protein